MKGSEVVWVVCMMCMMKKIGRDRRAAHRMRRIPVTVLVLTVLLLAGVGCVGVPTADLSYADKGFSVTVQGEMCRTAAVAINGEQAITGVDGVGEPMAFAATVTIAPPTVGEGGAAGREMTVTFTAPAALAGVTVTRRVGADGRAVTTVCRGDFTVTDADPDGRAYDGRAYDGRAYDGRAYDGLLLPAYTCLPTGDVTAVTPVVDGRQTVTLTGDGTEQTMTFEVTGEAGGIPGHIRLTHATGWVEVQVTPTDDADG